MLITRLAVLSTTILYSTVDNTWLLIKKQVKKFLLRYDSQKKLYIEWDYFSGVI